jgi:hypothetical protein
MINIAGTYKTPHLQFDEQSGKLNIWGKSFSENSKEFYKPLIEKIKDYKKAPCPLTVIDIKLEYINSSSSKSIQDIIREFESMKALSKIMINWNYESDDEDMLEAGEDYQSKSSLHFNLIEIDK